MENSANVFSSNITRVGNHKNNLYDLLNIVPATPLKINDVKIYTCDYTPKTDKYYVPKRRSKLKVKTVRDIRKSFEQDIYSSLFTDLETQQNVLFKRIRHGSSRNDKTKKMAIQILRGDTPISRSTWQMLVNLNPEQHKHPRQFVLWDGKYIQVNGSFGGNNKLICNYDLACTKLPSQNNKKIVLKHNAENRKKGLLRNSLNVKFKPGPLSKKKYLDHSHQKFHVGNIEIIDLPKPGLDIKPTYGTALEPTITNFLNSWRKEDGTISQKWAELAISVLGTIEKSKIIQLNRDCVTFDLAYKYNQNRLLMRRDEDHDYNTSKLIGTGTHQQQKQLQVYTNKHTVEINVQPEIEDMMKQILDAVEINIIQDKIYTQEQEAKPFPLEDLNSMDMLTHVRDKSKRKFCELDRLDVTVITLPETKERNLTRSCGKMHCSYGCICASIEGAYNLKQHCGRVECMFDCKCDFSKYKDNMLYTECSDLLPKILGIDNELNLNLAKEEQKFHQTVIVTGEKRILLKGEKRNWKSSKKYADFYSNMNLKHENEKKQVLSIVALKLNCDNIEPWCMVHKLYKCFCKGKFTETCASVSNETVAKESLCKDTVNDVEYLGGNSKATNDNYSIEESVLTRTNLERTNSVKKTKLSDNPHKKSNKTYTSKSMDKSTYANNMTENSNFDLENEIQINHIPVKDPGNVLKSSSLSEVIDINVEKSMITRHALRKFNMQQNSSKENNKKREISDSDDCDYLEFLDDRCMTSSRTSAYEGRKYSDGYYKNTNSKILEMEKNDKRLQERLAILNNKIFEEKANIKPTSETSNGTSLLELLCDANQDSNDMIPKTKRKRLSNETRLVSWLETNYKTYKNRSDRGLFKNSLEPPQHGKVALHSWDFILKRYRERKNLFLVSRQKPFRIFMAVNTQSPFFANCININDIRFADLHKYPQTVKNLLINATDLKDNFCILRGLSCCWELIGSVTKVNESYEHGTECEDTSVINIESSNMDTLSEFSHNNLVDKNSLVENKNTEQKDTQCNAKKDFKINTACLEDVGSSKWFVMTIENDFSEIRFFRKGFFVKYESIINAISVARLSGKTVRLSSKKCIEQPEIPQFGIYAIPNDNEYCVFVGPYEMEDTLGIETIKTILDVRRLKRTRGFWITTNKVDNLKVVENPLSFVPLSNTHNNNAMPLETHFHTNDDMNINQQEKSNIPESITSNNMEESKDCSPSKKEIKIVKPIKIRKTNGFYHLASDGVLKKFSLQYPQHASKAMPVVLNSCINRGDDATKALFKSNAVSSDLPNPIFESSQELSTEATSQIKISSVVSIQTDDTITKSSKHERGMFILKPEEINRKLIKNQLMTEITLAPSDECNIDTTPNFSLLESGLDVPTTSTECSALSDDIYVISDDENDATNRTAENCNIWTNVCIECTNIPNLGKIAGIRNLDNLLSFKLPGCEYSEFYTEEEAFAKINTELFKRINSSMDFTLEWKVHESTDQLQGHEINPEHLYPDYILTREGLLHTSDIIKSNKDNLKTYSKIQQKGKDRGSAREIVNKGNLLLGIEETSRNEETSRDEETGRNEETSRNEETGRNEEDQH